MPESLICMQQIWKTVAILTGILTVAVAILEAVVRLFLPYNAAFDDRQLSSLQYRPSGLVRQVMVPHQLVFAVGADGYVHRDSILYRINRWGYRGDDWYLDSGAVRIAIMGGSHVFDIGARDGRGEKPWPELLERQLQMSGLNVQVFNLGIPGASTPEIVARTLYDVPFLSPHLVIVNSTWNDLKWILNSPYFLSWLQPGAMKANPFVEKVTLLDDVFGWSAVYRKLRDAYYRNRYGINDTTGPVETLPHIALSVVAEREMTGLRQYELNLKAFVQIVRSMGAEPVLAIEERLVHPANTAEQKKRIRYEFIAPNMTHDKLMTLFASCDSIVLKVSRELNVEVIDVNNSLQTNADAFFSDHIHTTAEGSRALASAYAQRLLPMIRARSASHSSHQQNNPINGE